MACARVLVFHILAARCFDALDLKVNSNADNVHDAKCNENYK